MATLTAFSRLNRLARSLGFMLLCGSSMATQAQSGLTPAAYFECQIAARQATVAGLQERQATLSKGRGTNAERQATAETARARVTQAFGKCGYSASVLGAYAHRNADLLQSWLAENPQVQARLDAEAQRVAGLVDQAPSAEAAAPTQR
jgi:hypothetical protein